MTLVKKRTVLSSVEQIVGIPVPGRRGSSGYGGLQGLHPELSSLQPSDEQIVEVPVPGGGLQKSPSGQSSAASSSVQPEVPLEGAFRTFPWPKKSAKVARQVSARVVGSGSSRGS